MSEEFILVPVGDDIQRMAVARYHEGRNIPVSVLTVTYEGDMPFAAFAEEKDAQMFAAAPDLLAAIMAQSEIIELAQEVLTAYLVPDGGMDEDVVIDRLLEILDGPRWQAAHELRCAALRKFRGEA